MSKKRNLNELRQVKDAVYKAPKSYKKIVAENKTIRFSQDDLHDFSVELLQDILGISSINIEEDLIHDHIKSYFE